MCGRYYIDDGEDQAEMLRILAAANEGYRGKALASKLKTGEIFPTEVVPVVAAVPDRGDTASVQLMQWGMLSRDFGRVIINARSESAAEKPMFHQSVRQGRVLVPASNFFEWRKQPDSKRKTRVCLGVPGADFFYMAGLWRSERLSPADAEKLFDEPITEAVINRFVIITMAASEWMSSIHDRMPLILTREAGQRWLFDTEAALAILANPLASPLAACDRII
jgi:putative SOS response-associated peptidase YedK